MRRRALLSASALLVSACQDPAPPPPEGVDVAAGPCGHALFVLSSDYQSTSVAVVGYDGAILAPSIVSSASETTGLSVPLSGDVVAPTARTVDGSLLLIDRNLAVLSVFDPKQASVVAQIELGTGFNANPQDAIEIDSNRVFVTRYESNLAAGKQPFDAGSDILVVDLAAAQIEGRVDLTDAMAGAALGILPRPSRMVAHDGRVFVLLSAYSQSFAESDDGRVAVVDAETHTVESFVVLDGMRGCSALALSPSSNRLAVGCSGTFALTNTPSLEDSGLVILDLAEDGSLSEATRLSASALGGDPLSFSVAFASDDRVLTATLGRTDNDFEQERPDRLLDVAIGSGAVSELARTKAKPFSFGDVRCEPACGACFATDAERVAVMRIPLGEGADAMPELLTIDDGIGLPPRFLGAY